MIPVNDLRPIRVALLGCGTVGSQVVRLLREQADELAARAGSPVELVGVAVRRPHRHPELGNLLTTDATALVTRDDVDVVVEVIGGIEPARTLLLEALKARKSVVTANKALLAEDGATLAEAADAAGVDLYYEASVAGAIPLLRPLRESLAGDRITRVAGIVNGTTNFILSAMAVSGSSYADALEEATRLGYAEADPSADVDGYDAASKAAILASLAFHTRVTADDVYREGIRQVSAADIAAAAELGCKIKLLAICERTPGDGDEPETVPPGSIHASTPAWSVRGVGWSICCTATTASGRASTRRSGGCSKPRPRPARHSAGTSPSTRPATGAASRRSSSARPASSRAGCRGSPSASACRRPAWWCGGRCTSGWAGSTGAAGSRRTGRCGSGSPPIGLSPTSRSHSLSIGCTRCLGPVECCAPARTCGTCAG